ncbi:RHS repeat-associated core domain-containing protein, partial [Bacillus subtilis]
IGGLRLSMQISGNTYYYHYNPHGDVVAMTDENGNIVVRYTYDAWGNVQKQVTSGQPNIKNPFTYSGYMQDDETGIYYLISRYYNPEQGVFLST